MIVLGSDEHNFHIGIDLLQAKMLVAICRQLLIKPGLSQLFVDASEEVNRDGFEVLGTDIMAATMAVSSTLGFFTKPVRRAVPQAPPPPAAAEPSQAALEPAVAVTEGEEVPATPKPPPVN